MARTSRIQHPIGARYTQIFAWAVRAVGLGGAAVLGVIDFLDRAEDLPGRPVVSRARLIADLEGIVGRNTVDAALLQLADLGWLRRHQQRVLGPNNLQTSYLYSLDAQKLSEFLGGQENTEVEDYRDPGFGSPGLPISRPRGSQKRNRGGDRSRESSTKRKTKTAEAATVVVAADPGQAKKRVSRGSGILTYTTVDVTAAQRLEWQWPCSWLTSVTRRLVAAGKEPLPARVEAALDVAAGELGRELQRYLQQKSTLDRPHDVGAASPHAAAALNAGRRLRAVHLPP